MQQARVLGFHGRPDGHARGTAGEEKGFVRTIHCGQGSSLSGAWSCPSGAVVRAGGAEDSSPGSGAVGVAVEQGWSEGEREQEGELAERQAPKLEEALLHPDGQDAVLSRNIRGCTATQTAVRED